jgi:hypothetical protein
MLEMPQTIIWLARNGIVVFYTAMSVFDIQFRYFYVFVVVLEIMIETGYISKSVL